MTAFSPSQIPSSIKSIEQLHAWTAVILQNLYGSSTVIEETGKAELSAQCSPFYITASSTPQWRLITRTSIAISSDWQKTGKLWTAAQDLGSQAIPTEFTQS